MQTVKLRTKAQITAFGTYVPERRLTNEDLSHMVDTNHEWIVQRTGMIERRIVDEGTYASDLAFEAVKNLADTYHVDLQTVDAVLVATSTPDAFFPSTAGIIQGRLGIPQAMALDISNACAGFVSAMQLAIGLIDAGMHRKVLVIGTEVLTRTVDYTDRSTSILFGDGAGAILLEAGTAEQQSCFLASGSLTTGDLGGILHRKAVADRIGDVEMKPDSTLVQNGREVLKWALRQVPVGIQQLLQDTGYTTEQIEIFVPHSANLRMIESICERSGIPLERTLTSVQYYGNTSAASIPLAIAGGLADGRLKPGALTLLYGFGGGFSQSILLLRWPDLRA
ncbi:3-oxoacyl-(acyl carrier protein) synthase III [Paenibacillus alvei TS-15]|uniref:Beta-ketoacyl-[acyl-carrier-protein] synthase III n=1 Tax=Paenibacillus alvei TS-15 TaxID=1117108 RepID=S9SSS9_PAEAL|nr:ketoacyl-ACP synthase III [Paenibacillus alvei]EPY07764.1 3-oxoacyl-(acyl carrier protein) synthase III [Paenibacillus alvei TS-15]